MKSIKKVERYFELAIRSKLIRFVVEDTWLTVEYHESLGFEPSKDGWRWSLLCAQDLRDYRTPLELCNRITLMLAEKARSAQQDVNGLMKERRNAK